MSFAAGGSARGARGGRLLDWYESFAYNDIGGTGYLSGFTVRHTVSAANLSLSGEKIRISIRAGNSGITVNPVYIGEAVSTGSYSFKNTPTQVFFNGGSASLTLGSQAIGTSDSIDLALDSTKPLVVSWFMSAGTGTDIAAGGGVDTTYAGGNSAVNQSFSGSGGGG